jgi:hypothetical protein
VELDFAGVLVFDFAGLGVAVRADAAAPPGAATDFDC